jgi:hypothetical protein
MRRWLTFNGLALVMFGAFLVFLVLQTVFGWQAHNSDLADFGRPAIGYGSYLASGDAAEATFENWESEFLQIGSYALLTAFLVQRGSAESKPLDAAGQQAPARADRDEPKAPGPVRRGGLMLRLYEHSLSIALLGLFVLSFLLHLLGGTAAYNEEQSWHGQPRVSVGEFFTNSEFWFQSMQNWQSEFVAVGLLVVLTIFLRQRGSSQSKPVAAPHEQTGG